MQTTDELLWHRESFQESLEHLCCGVLWTDPPLHPELQEQELEMEPRHSVRPLILRTEAVRIPRLGSIELTLL